MNLSKEEFKELINRKILMEKLLKNKRKSNIIVSNTGQFNIVNGSFVTTALEKETEKDKEVEKDPFNLTFEEGNNNSLNNEYDLGKLNFDLDLNHFFNNDNFLN